MTRPKAAETPSIDDHRDSDSITAEDIKQMKQIFEESKRIVKPIVKRESAAEIVSAELLNIRLKDAHRA